MWSSAAWRELAVAWLDEHLAAAGIRRTGEVSQPHVRPWATALTATTTGGVVWMKATGPGTAFEVALYELLHRVAPGRVLAPIASDVARGWIVLPDGGVPLGERVTGTELVGALATVLPRYGQLQRDVAPHVADLLASGVSDMRPAIMPRRFDEALDVAQGYVERHGGLNDRATCERLTALRETFAGWCDRLAQAPASPSVDHNDLHPWNMLVADGDDPGDARLYDWGDSVVAHPFASMLVPLGWIERQLGFGPGAPEIGRVRDAYLAVFGDLAPPGELVETLELACHVSKAARALTWSRALQTLGDDEAGEHTDAPLRTLSALLDDSYLGGPERRRARPAWRPPPAALRAAPDRRSGRLVGRPGPQTA